MNLRKIKDELKPPKYNKKLMTENPRYLFSLSTNSMCSLARNGCDYVVYSKGPKAGE